MTGTQTEPSSKSKATKQLVVDAAVAVGLLCGLAVAYAVDSRVEFAKSQVPVPVPKPPTPPSEPPPPPPKPPVFVPPEESLPPIDPVRRVVVDYTSDLRFGLTTTTGNPDDRGDDGKQLTYDENGGTNNTRLWVDGDTPLVGSDEGAMVCGMTQRGEGTLEAEWKYEDISVSQTIEYVAGESSRRMDTIRVGYLLKNSGTQEHEVGLRVMLDSLIGDNDGVPFVISGQEGALVRSRRSYEGEDVPDFVRALERADLVRPGVIADLGLHPVEGERPDKVILTGWPGGDADWTYTPRRSFDIDTAIGLYYNPRPLRPGKERLIRLTYGLGSISSTKSRNAVLSLTAGPPFRSGGDFWLVALVQNPLQGQKITVELGKGLSLADGHEATKSVKTGGGTVQTQLSWLVHISPATFGTVEVEAELAPGGIREQYTVNVQPRDARLLLAVSDSTSVGKPFYVTAAVQHSRAGQTVQLTLPRALKLADGHRPTKSVPAGREYAQVHWLIDAPPESAAGNVEVSVSLTPDNIEQQIPFEIVHERHLIE